MALSTERAWNALHDPLRLFIRKRVPDENSAEDLLQDVFLKIHTHIGALRDEEKLESWVYQIARNLIIDYYRRQTPTTPWEEAEPLLPVEEIPEEDVRAELAPSVVAMARYLPEPYREALLLTDYQGVSQKELSARLGLSFSGAKSRVQRAREKLKQLLLDCCHFEFDRLGRVIDYQPRCHCCEQQTCGPHCL
jgi:RNA polymerase sigma-70 factor, ECF subfamily